MATKKQGLGTRLRTVVALGALPLREVAQATTAMAEAPLRRAIPSQLQTLAELVPLLGAREVTRFVEAATRAFRASDTTHRENQRMALAILPFAAPRQAFAFLTELLFAEVETELELWYAGLPPLLAAAERIAPGTKERLPPMLLRLARPQG